jgi:hypothetical protein
MDNININKSITFGMIGLGMAGLSFLIYKKLNNLEKDSNIDK